MAPRSADFLTTSERSALMRRVKGVGAEPERLLASALRKRRIAFRATGTDLPGKPDLVLTRARLAVFIDGELWHGVQWRRRGLNRLEEQFSRSRSPGYWIRKIRGNVERDFRNTRALLDLGWRVLRFWEADVRNDPDACAQVIAEAKTTVADISAAAAAPARTVCEFFAGMGLMRLGLDGAGWSTLWANDFDANKHRLYRALFPDAAEHLDTRDINQIDASDIPTCTLATASFPCVDLSLAGAQRGLNRDTRSGVYLRFIDILRDMGARRPPLVLLENVTGLLSSNGGADLELCLRMLAELGYSVDAFTLTAQHFVPQSRPRMFIVGTHESCGRHAEIPLDELAPDPDLRPERLVAFMRARADLPWSLRRLPALPRRQMTVADIVEALPEDDLRWWDAKRTAHFVAQVSANHRDEMADRRRGEEFTYATAFRRMRAGASTAELRFDGVAGCLRTPKGGSAKQILVRMGRGRVRVRLLTPRECGRLMGIEDYALPKGMRDDDALFGFGDAVCVPAITWIAKNYLDPLATEMLRGRVLNSAPAPKRRKSPAQAVARSAGIAKSAKRPATRRREA